MYFCHSFLKLKQLFAVKIFRFLFVYMAIVFSKEMVKCLWSNSQSSSTDCLCSEGPKYADFMLEKYILLLFMFKTVVLLNIFVETLMQKSNHCNFYAVVLTKSINFLKKYYILFILFCLYVCA